MNVFRGIRNGLAISLVMWALIGLAVVSIAEAHTLSKYRAASSAEAAIDRYASNSERWFEALVDVDYISPGDCVRQSAHRVWCIGGFEMNTIAGYEYADGTDFILCNIQATVRFASRYSHRLVTRVYGEECF